MKEKIKEAIYSTLVIDNKESFDFCWDKIKPLINSMCDIAYNKGFKDGYEFPKEELSEEIK